MLTLPPEILALLARFSPLFSSRTWAYVPALMAGAILAPGRRTVSGVLRALGLGQATWFQNFHQVLNRAGYPARVVTPLAASRGLLRLLIAARGPGP